jgi:NADPH2:quinone reductase
MGKKIARVAADCRVVAIAAYPAATTRERNMVRAIRVHETGGPEVMKLEDVPAVPPGKGELRIRHKAMGLNYIDTYFRSGLYPTQKPFTPGNEGAGDVIAVGEAVKGFKVGDRVAYCSSPGSYADERNVPAAVVVKLPQSVSYQQAAAMMLKGLTAEYLLFRSYPVKKGDTVLIHAAAGGVGVILTQWARKLGATVIGTVGSKDKAKIAKKNGCHHVILYRDEDFVAKVKEITGGKLCNVVYDGVGKSTFPASLDCLRPLGYFISFGNASGAIEAFNVGLLSAKGSLYAQRPTLFNYIGDRKRLDEMARRLFKVVASEAVKIPIKAKYKLSEAVKAHQALEGRQTTGSVIFVP